MAKEPTPLAYDFDFSERALPVAGDSVKPSVDAAGR